MRQQMTASRFNTLFTDISYQAVLGPPLQVAVWVAVSAARELQAHREKSGGVREASWCERSVVV